MLQTKLVEKIKSHILCSVTFFYFFIYFFPGNRPVYEVRWKNVVDRGRPQMTIWRTCIACWIPKATNTHSEYVILIAFPLQLWLHDRSSVLRFTYIACLGLFSEGPRPVLGSNQLPIQCTSKAFFPGGNAVGASSRPLTST